jgi:hypothetical protein
MASTQGQTTSPKEHASMPLRRRCKAAVKLCRMLSAGIQTSCPSPLLSAQDEADLHIILRKLIKIIPAAFPVELRITNMTLTDGWCSRYPDRFLIMLSGCVSRGQSINVLLHEYAHALAWNHSDISEETFERLSHGPAWGVAVSSVYQAFITKIRPHIQMPSVAETDEDNVVYCKGVKA